LGEDSVVRTGYKVSKATFDYRNGRLIMAIDEHPSEEPDYDVSHSLAVKEWNGETWQGLGNITQAQGQCPVVRLDSNGNVYLAFNITGGGRVSTLKVDKVILNHFIRE
jgi:hypothetical protein